jgi:predicted anti-sigma-YlaC factor YlaD
MIVRPATAVDIERVVCNMRRDDVFEVYSDRFDKTPEALIADFVAARPRMLGLLALCGDGGYAIALLGAQLVTPARADVIMIATKEWPEIAAAATRYALRKAIPIYLGGVRSAECRAWDGNHVSRRWLARLGFRVAAELPLHDESGATFLLYRWLNPKFTGVISRNRGAAYGGHGATPSPPGPAP